MPLNYAKTALLLLAMTAIFVVLGAVVGGQSGMAIALVVALVMNFVSFWSSDSFVLRMHGAQQVDAQSAPEYYGLVADLAARAGLPVPRVCIMQSPQPNAFATGRSPSHSAVCASTGLLDMLSREQVAAVMAHELAHIKNRDTLTMTVAAAMAGAISTVANMLQFGLLFGRSRNNSAHNGWITRLAVIIVAPFAAMLVQMAISRSREYQADRLGAMICGNPLWLASALQAIQGYARQIPNETAEAVPATAHMFIINPLSGRGIDSWFKTHPATENRVAELQQMAIEWGMSDAGVAGSALPGIAAQGAVGDMSTGQQGADFHTGSGPKRGGRFLPEVVSQSGSRPRSGGGPWSRSK